MEGIRQRKRDRYEELPTRSPSRQKPEPAALPTWSSAVTFGIFIMFLQFIMSYNQQLPAALKIADEEKFNSSFITERAKNDLTDLVKLGPKVTGSYECEVLAPRLLRQKISDIAKTANPVHLLQEHLQRPKGSFPLSLKPHGFYSIYENIQNLAVRIGPKPPSNYSVLVNCHFDTVPDSPGASDNGLNCAVMLEVLRKISRRPEPLKNNIIFLFNGAEEQLLQGSHGFISAHHWREEVRMVVNLDAAGAGGREFLFQAAPDYPWILKAYARAVPHPSATLAGQEVFDSGLIPSDTDYRVFRDFGPIPGIDLAHGDNGYIYHTRLDKMDYISDGVFQHTGDNLLALLLELAQAPELEDMDSSRVPNARLIYYDIFDSFMIVYSNLEGVIINLFVFFTTSLYLYLTPAPKQFTAEKQLTVFTAFGRVLLGIFLALVTSIVLAIIMDRCAPLSWYANPHYILPLYVFPYVAVVLFFWALQNIPGGYDSALEYFRGGQALTAIVFLAITLLGIRSSYLFMLLLLPPTTAGVLTIQLKSAKTRLLILTATSLLGLALFFFSAISFYFLLIPIAARFGNSQNPEYLIGSLTFLVCFVTGNALIPLLVAVRKPLLVGLVFAFLHVVALLAIIFTPLGFPYSASAPALQRFYLYHTEQIEFSPHGEVVGRVSGVYILPMDRNGMKYVIKDGTMLKNAVPVQQNDPDRLLRHFPLYNSRYIELAKTSMWVPLTPPSIPKSAPNLTLLGRSILGDQHSLSFRVKGSDHNTVIISSRENCAIKNWTLSHQPQSISYNGKSYYVLYFSIGDKETQDFGISLESVGNPCHLLDVTIIAHYQHHKESYSSEFKKLLREFPDWTQATAWLAIVHSHSFYV